MTETTDLKNPSVIKQDQRLLENCERTGVDDLAEALAVQLEIRTLDPASVTTPRNSKLESKPEEQPHETQSKPTQTECEAAKRSPAKNPPLETPNALCKSEEESSPLQKKKGRPPPRERVILTPRQLREQDPSLNVIQTPTAPEIANIIKSGKAKNIVVMTGAGISTAAGIPDFRSPGTGLYDNLQKYDLPYAEAIFDIEYFKETPEPFYALAKELYPGSYKPTLCHYFVRLLNEKGILLRHFTQNIDTLERVARLPEEKIVEAHGSFHSAHCVDPACRTAYPQKWVKEQIFRGEIPVCSTCGHRVKPDIVFFGEGLPSRFFEMALQDFKKCDLLIVIGTSLQVQPFAGLIDKVRSNVPRFLINKEEVGVRDPPHMSKGFCFDGEVQKYRRDAVYLGDCDEGVLELARLCDMEADLRALYASEHLRLDDEMVAEKAAMEAAIRAAVSVFDDVKSAGCIQELSLSATPDLVLGESGNTCIPVVCKSESDLTLPISFDSTTVGEIRGEEEDIKLVSEMKIRGEEEDIKLVSEMTRLEL